MCNFGARAECRNWRKAVSSYLDVETSDYQYYSVNPTPLEFIVGYIMEDTIGDRALKIMPWKRLKIIHGSILSY